MNTFISQDRLNWILGEMLYFQCSEDLKSSRLCTNPNKTFFWRPTWTYLDSFFMVQVASCYVPGYHATLMTVSKLDQQPRPGRKQFIHFLVLFLMLKWGSVNILFFLTLWIIPTFTCRYGIVSEDRLAIYNFVTPFFFSSCKKLMIPAFLHIIFAQVEWVLYWWVVFS